MACLDMYNSEHKGHCAPMSPRISFSNDFVESHGQQIIKQERSPRDQGPVSSDFEFSVTNYSMMSADELFSKGKLLPFKDSYRSSNQMQRTLREELLVEDDNNDGVSLRPPKGSTRWKGFLGLKSTHIGSKKAEKIDSFVERIGESKKFAFVHEEAHLNKTPQELLSEGEPSCSDVEIGI